MMLFIKISEKATELDAKDFLEAYANEIRDLSKNINKKMIIR